MSLSVHPRRKCTWGGKPCLITSHNQIRGTVFIQPVGDHRYKPYAVGYESVELTNTNKR